MHPSKFGDSYDIVKRSVLQWLSCCGEWSVHPMLFTKPICESFANRFAEFLGVPLVEKQSPDKLSDRASLLEVARSTSSHLFLDPDTGLSLPPSAKTPRHVRADDLVEIAEARKDKLTLVFDQSIHRVKDAEPKVKQLKKKLEWLKQNGLHGVAYCSHANFILVSKNEDVFNKAKCTLLKKSKLPDKRLIGIGQDAS